MQTEVKIKDAIGKTLEGIVFSYTCGQALLKFTDGTFTVLGVFINYAGEGEVGETTLDLHNFGNDKLIDAGIATAEELETIRAKRIADMLAVWAQRDLKEYERLKCKFEG